MEEEIARLASIAEDNVELRRQHKQQYLAHLSSI